MRRMLNLFHLEVCVERVLPVRDHPVICKEDRVRTFEVGLEGFRNLAGRWSGILRERNRPESEYHFREYAGAERLAGNGETGCIRRMRMHHRVNIRSAAVNEEV